MNGKNLFHAHAGSDFAHCDGRARFFAMLAAQHQPFKYLDFFLTLVGVFLMHPHGVACFNVGNVLALDLRGEIFDLLFHNDISVCIGFANNCGL